MKTKEELSALKEEVETLNKKLAELSEEELEQVSGGRPGEWTPTVSKKGWVCKNCGNVQVTWEKGGVLVLAPDEPIMCSNCGSLHSFEINDL